MLLNIKNHYHHHRHSLQIDKMQRLSISDGDKSPTSPITPPRSPGSRPRILLPKPSRILRPSKSLPSFRMHSNSSPTPSTKESNLRVCNSVVLNGSMLNILVLNELEFKKKLWCFDINTKFAYERQLVGHTGNENVLTHTNISEQQVGRLDPFEIKYIVAQQSTSSFSMSKMKSKMKGIIRTDSYRDFDIRSSAKLLRRSHSVHTMKRENRNQSDSGNNINNNNTTSNKNSLIMKMKEQRDYDNIHIALVGAKSCGKSALAVRYLTKRFIGEYDSHKDVTLQRSMTVADREVRVTLKDTTGTGWLKSPSLLINWTSAIVVVYSITDRASFASARNILDLVHKTKPLSSRCTLLIGNKCDLNYVRQVEICEAKRLADDFGVQFLECSAAENYEDILSCFTRLLVEAMIVQSTKKHSWDDQNGEEVRQQENKIRKRSISLSHQAQTYKDNNNNNTFLAVKEKKDSLIRIGDDRIPSPIGEQPVPQRKQSLRRKLSGILQNNR